LLTDGDVERIAHDTGQTDFFEYRIPRDPAYLDQADDPNWLRYTIGQNGARRVLNQTFDGDCCFLTPQGCRLALETRPLVCRLYPYYYTEDGLNGVEAGCPQEYLEPGQTILDALQMSYEQALRWWALLYSELRTEYALHGA
jgi:Fe-S-cluster containining protein